MSAEAVTIWGDFTCPWSYLAWSRAELLADDGVEIEWRGVEHEPWRHLTPVDVSDRYQALHAEMPRVLAHLLPDEDLPYTLAGFVPFTAAATAAYAEAHVAGVARPALRRLFRAFWLQAVDLNSPRILQTLLAEDLRRGSSPSELVSTWGYAIDVTGGPITTFAWRAVRDWRDEWQKAGGITPTIRVGTHLIVGVDAVDWLGEQVRARALLPSGDREREHPAA